MQLIALACPRCGGALESAAGRRVFVCDACGQSSEPRAIGGDRLAGRLFEVGREVARSRLPWPEVGGIVLLPVWVMPVLRAGDAPWLEGLPREVRLPAIGYDRMEVLLRFAAHLTRVEIPWEVVPTVESAPRLRRAPAEITAEEALAAAEPVLVSLAGEQQERMLTGGPVPLGAPRLVDLPCHRVAGRLSDLVCDRWVSDVLLAATDLPDQRTALSAYMAAAHR
jgi:hypothetical protein